MKVLITGGAGFIGSTVGSALLDRGFTPVILDNLSTGREAFAAGRPFYRGDIADRHLVDRIFVEHPDIWATVHCAGLIVVPESVQEPLRYYRENVLKAIELIDLVVRNDCRRILFSSTAALYRPGPDFAVDEASPVDPGSPYARTKAMVEAVLADCAAAGGLRAIALRYFNPIGADPLLRTGLPIANPSHALGRMIEAWASGEPFPITGTNWPTRDGTAIRDYIHVWDLAQAHVAALERFDQVTEPGGFEVINVGTGAGTTVRELLDAFSAATRAPLPHREAEPRPGDLAGVYNRSRRCETMLRWSAKYDMEEAIRHALEWRTLDRGNAEERLFDRRAKPVAAGSDGRSPAAE